MAIFRRDSPEPANSPSSSAAGRTASRQAAPAQVTTIATGTRIVGEITGATDLAIEGRVEGVVNLEAEITVKPGGEAEGELRARAVHIGGKVQGNVQGSDLVELTASGSLEGDISAKRVIIAEGAYFKGKVQMGG